MGRATGFATEAELAAAVVSYLQGFHWTVYQEVQLHRQSTRADIVATQGPLVWIVETKLRFGIDVLAQAWRWRGYAHYLSVGVPTPNHGATTELLMDLAEKHYGIGVLGIDRSGQSYWQGTPRSTREHVGPRLFRRAPHAAELRGALREEMKAGYAPAGTNQGGYWTPWKQTCAEIRRAVRRAEGGTTRELVASIQHHYGSDTTARSTLLRWAQGQKIEGVRVERGDDGQYRWYLTGKGA